MIDVGRPATSQELTDSSRQTSLSDMADPERLALVQGFRGEVAREVRAAEFSDLRGLVQGAEHWRPG